MPIISDQDAAEFISGERSVEDITSLSVSELRVICSLLGCESPTTLHKTDLIKFVSLRLFSEVEGEFVSSDIPPTDTCDDVSDDENVAPPDQGNVDSLSNTESFILKQLELQVKLEEAKNVNLDKQIQLANVSKSPVSNSVSQTPHFDLSSAVKVMPKFSDDNVDEFFCAFERLAHVMSWPQKYWTVLLQQALTGKALRAYASLSDNDAMDYAIVKEEILKAYSLVPEAYRKRFRGLCKKPDQTYLEFASVKRDYFSRWLKSTDVTQYDSLVNLILCEDFLSSVNKDVSMYLVDKEFSTIEEAAKQADCFSLRQGKHNNYSSQASRTNTPAFNFKHGKTGNVGTAHKKVNFAPSPNKSSYSPKPTCNFCGRDGHIATFCYRRLKQFEKPKPVLCACGSFVPSTNFPTSSDVAVAKQNATQDLSLASTSALSTANQHASFASENAVASELSASAEKPVAFLAQSCESDAFLQDVNAPVVDKDPNVGTYEAFLSDGTVSVQDNSVPVTVLRDTGSLQTLIRQGVITGKPTGKFVVLSTLFGRSSAPLINVTLNTTCYTGTAMVAEVPELPIPNVDILLGNDLAGSNIDSIFPAPILQEQPDASAELLSLEEDLPEVFPLCAVTRSMTQPRRATLHSLNEELNHDEFEEEKEGDYNLSRLFQPSMHANQSFPDRKLGREALVKAQRDDVSLLPLFEQAQGSESESGPTTSYLLEDGVLFRRWLPPSYSHDDAPWAAINQIVIPSVYRKALLEIAHDGHFSGHFGVRKTQDKIARNFYWPHFKRDVATYVKSCPVCQKVGKPNAKIPLAPLVFVPHVPEPFSVIQIDIVGPLPKTTRGHNYLLTMLDVSTRYVHATPLRVVSAKNIVKSMLDFFSHFGMPRCIQTDGASYFVGNVFKAALNEWGIQHRVSSPYHPQTQGAVERSHQTIKSILKKYALQFDAHWDDDLPYLLFALREVPNESTGFSPSELVFAHEVRGPLHVIRDQLLDSTEKRFSLFDLVSTVKVRMRRCKQLAEEQIIHSKERTKVWYDKRARHREFAVGDKVLALIPLQGRPMQAKFSGPYEVIKKISPTNYIISTPDRRRAQRLCHINMLKEFLSRDAAEPVPVAFVQAPSEEYQQDVEPLFLSSTRVWKQNSAVLEEKLQHLSQLQRDEVLSLINKYPDVFSDKPGRTTAATHDIDVGAAKPIKLPPYRVHPSQVAQVKAELHGRMVFTCDARS